MTSAVSPQLERPVRYVVISPVRDEAQYLDETIRCVVEQTVRPIRYILVDDGSSDDTLAIIEKWAREYSWIVPIHRADTTATAPTTQARGKRAREAKEICAFYHGYDQLDVDDWQFLIKLDGDLGFARDYFARCFMEFDKDPGLGVGGGVILNLVDGKPVLERTPQFHVRGATKIYRAACWKAMGGVSRGAAWDTLDELKANMLGWSSRSFADLEVLHYRYTGTANGKWQNAVKNGEWNYISGYHPLFMAVKVVRNLHRTPRLKRAAGLLYGYLRALLTHTTQVNDPQLIRYIRSQQLRRLSLRQTIWR